MLVQHMETITVYLKEKGVADIFPRYENRSAWENVPQDLSGKLIANAEKRIKYDWPVLKASEYLEFFDDGVHGGVYHKKFMKRRNVLGQLMMAECLEGQGRFLKDIINGIYVICEESTWVVPQHNAILNVEREIDNKLPSFKTGHIDLFAAETAALLTWAQYLLRKPLDEISINVCQRIDDELMDRIILPYLRSDRFHWMGFAKGSGAKGNWTPWVNSNCLMTFLYGCKDPYLRVQGVRKVMESVQIYADHIGDEGGCNEGPVYWTVAAGMLFDLMDCLSLATDEVVDFFDSQKFKNMGNYIYKLYIGDHAYVNFADASSKDHGTKDGGLLYRYGIKSGDEHLMNLGAAVMKRNIGMMADKDEFQLSLSHNSFRTYRNFWNIFNYKAMMDHGDQEPLIRDAYIADVQVASAREQEGSPEGFFLCAKGGHNRESHNHNDVGHFVLYHNSRPVCIDPGALPYTLDYFRENRYKYWATRSDHHNTPVINGQVQMPGETFQATKVAYKTDDQGMRFQMNLEASYPASAKVAEWQRVYELSRQGSSMVSVADSFKLEEVVGDTSRVLMTPRQVSVPEEGKIIFGAYEDSPQVTVTLNEGMAVQVENIDLADTPKLVAEWGPSLQRVVISPMAEVSQGDWFMRFSV